LSRETSFADRKDSGKILESLNNHLSFPDPPIAPFSEARVKLTANTDLKKFSYKPMAMRLSEASEVLDDRIDEFAQLIQDHHKLEDNAIGNPASQRTSEIVAVGRIASDSLEGKLNTASLVLEASRRMGAGRRVPLKVDALPGYQFFPGQIVAFRGTNASGKYFSVSEVLNAPILPPAASTPAVLDSINERLGGSDPEQALNLLLGSGPYTADDNLDFEALQVLCDKAASDSVDALILTGPFLDTEHPLIASGNFDLPEIKGVDPDDVTLLTLFHLRISQPLQRLAAAIPSITIFIVPSARDIVNRHVSWPQDKLVKKELRLPSQAKLVPNPVFVSLNETVIGISSHDILYELRHEEITAGKVADSLARWPRHLIEQRHFSPVFPPVSRNDLPKNSSGGLATGAMMDISYLKLGEWWNVRPDVLITPSSLPPFVKV
jgi:DNA polymerase alpha subunit B